MPCLVLDEVLKSGRQSLPNGLCPACQPIFESVMRGDRRFCPNHRQQPEPHLHTRDQYHASTTTCPGCRLISSFFHFDEEMTSKAPTMNLLIEPRYFSTQENLDTERSQLCCGGVIVFIEGVRQVHPKGRIIATAHSQEDLRRGSGFDHIQELLGRIVPPIVDIDLIRGWMQSCSSNHEECNRMSTKPSTPLRLIDLENWRVIEANSGYKYTALSYVWGNNTEPLMTRERLPQFLVDGGLQQANVPRTVMDAMSLSKDIGYRFIWVDSICIVQDDADDKEMQLPNMGRIYGDADLVIAAATGESAHDGLPGIGSNVRKSWQRIESVGQWKFITTDPKVSMVVGETHWNTRGWTFQEAYLARRILLFVKTQIFWICQNMTWREDTHLESQPVSPESSGLESLWGSVDDFDQTPSAKRCRTREYCRNVEIFSGRTFKNKNDSLWAFTGILEAQAESFQEGYIWAVPLEILDAALLWIPYARCGCGELLQENIQSRLTRGVTHDAISYPVPSWAWLSSTSGVRFRGSCGNVVSEVSWLAPIEPRRPYNLSSWKFFLNQASQILRRPYTLLRATAAPTKLDIHYKHLHFSANVANLLVKLDESSKDSGTESEADDKGHRRLLGPWWKRLFNFGGLREAMSSLWHLWKSRNVASPLQFLSQATILLSGQEIGRVMVTGEYMRNGPEKLGQFVLLSSNTEDESDDCCIMSSSPLDHGNIIHKKNCDHVVSHNVMLIEWHGRIAYRRGLACIHKEDWAKVEVQKRVIILG